MKGNCGECDRRWFCDIDPDECDAWPDPVPVSNADRIRAMSDEELATTIHAIRWGWAATWCDYHCENEGDDGCDKCVLAWLKQPAEVTT